MNAIQLKTDHLTHAMGIDPDKVTLTWIPKEGRRQTAFQIKLESNGRLLHNSGKVVSHKMRYMPDIEIPSRTRVTWTVTLWDEEDLPGEESTAVFETGLAKEDWIARWIVPELCRPAYCRRATDLPFLNKASYLRREFEVADCKSARLYMTAHGVYDAYLNGVHLEGYFMAPGTTDYSRRLQVQTYDVTDLLKRGKNDLLVTLGEGWWRGSVGWNMNRYSYGTDLALLCQLEVDGKPFLCSDKSWQASQSGPLQENDTMRLERYDARRIISDWHVVKEECFGYENLIGTTVPITTHERFKARLFTAPNGEKVLDFGQNFAGYVELDLTAEGGEKIVLTHGEVLDKDGNFQNDNFQNPASPLCRQVIEYTCKPGRNHYHQTKCYYGFRYAKIETALPITGEEFTGVAVYSNMEQTGFFSCGVPQVNQLFQNILWSMKSNFVDVPTDCPHREKLGFTGDCQVFSAAALYLMDSYPVLQRWMRDLAVSQFEDGNILYVAPPKSGPQEAASGKDGSAGWCNAFEIVATRMMQFFNTTEEISEFYSGIKKWMLFNLERSKLTRPENEHLPREIRDYLMDCGNHWGEWCEPRRGPQDYKAELNATGHAEVATAFTAYGCLLTARMAERLGEAEDAEFFFDAYEKCKAAYRYVFTQDAAIKSERQCHYVRPVVHELLSKEEAQKAVDDLADLIRKNGNKIGTGFLTTCHLCDVLTDYGHADTAYDLLLQTEQPSWLYEVEQGATTTWESWFGIRDEGENKGLRKGSHNHYSFGAVSGWLMGKVLGIRVQDGSITLRPYPDRRLGHAEGSYLSPLGKIEAAWSYEGERILFTFSVPDGAEATAILPNGETHLLSAGSYDFKV